MNLLPLRTEKRIRFEIETLKKPLQINGMALYIVDLF